MKVFYATYKPKVKKTNQDVLLVGKKIISNVVFQKPKTIELNENTIIAIADGASSHKYSQIIGIKLMRSLRNLTNFTSSSIQKHLVYMQEYFSFEASFKPYLYGAVSTLSVCLLSDKSIEVFHIGDTRVYKIKNGLKQLTTDHTQAMRMLHSGEITKEAYKNRSSIYEVIENYFVYGENEDFFIDYSKFTCKQGDRFLVCSDGLWKKLDEGFVYQNGSLEVIAKKLFALMQTSDDDASFIVVEV